MNFMGQNKVKIFIEIKICQSCLLSKIHNKSEQITCFKDNFIRSLICLSMKSAIQVLNFS